MAAAALLAAGALFGAFGSAPGASAAAGGPVLLLGIDAEDGGPGGHGPIATYETMLTNVFTNVNNGGTGVLVLGADPNSDITDFWDTIATDTGRTVTYADGAAAIGSASFAGVGVVVISSSSDETPSGGIDDTENDALTGRSADIAAHVNAGGGLIVLNQNGLTSPFAFFGSLGSVTIDDIAVGQDDDIDVTPTGTAAGLSDALDVCCWHQQFLTWPGYLVPLATYVGSTEVSALGGASVIIGPVEPPRLTLDPSATTEPPSTVPATTEPSTTEPPTTSPGTTTPGISPPTTRPRIGVSPATGARPIGGRPTYTG